MTETEESEIEVDLTVSDRNHVGSDVSGEVVVESLDHREGHQGSEESNTSEVTRALKKTSVEVKHIRRICLSTSWLTQKETELTVSNCMLREIVVSSLVETTRVTVDLRNCSSSQMCGVLSTHSVSDWCKEERGVNPRITPLKDLEEANGSRATRSNSGDDTEKGTKRAYCRVANYLRDRRAESDSRLTRLTITDNELSLTISDREEDVNDTETSDNRWSLT